MDELRVFCGIDPGLKGAIAFIDQTGKILELHKMPIRRDGGVDHVALTKILAKHPRASVYVERALSFGMGSKSAFNYGRGFAAIEITLERLGSNAAYVLPAAWTRVLHKGYAHGDGAKAKSLLAAGDLFGIDALPKLRTGRVHDGIVDALLIASYARQQAFLN